MGIWVDRNHPPLLRGYSRTDWSLTRTWSVDNWPLNCMPIPTARIHCRENVVWSRDACNRPRVSFESVSNCASVDASVNWLCWSSFSSAVLPLPVQRRVVVSKWRSTRELLFSLEPTCFQISSIRRETSRCMKCRFGMLVVVWRNGGTVGSRPRPMKCTTLLYWIQMHGVSTRVECICLTNDIVATDDFIQ